MVGQLFRTFTRRFLQIAVIGLAGDEIKIHGREIEINGEALKLEELPGDLIRVTPKTPVLETAPPSLRPDTLDEARRLMPGADVYGLEADWRAMWARMGGRRLRSPDAAFLGWVKKRVSGER